MTTHSLTLRSSSPQDTLDLGKRLGSHLEAGMIILLSGELGAGKTWLARGIAFGLGVPEDETVTSPAYDLAHQYQGRIEVAHLDLYRLETIGIEDALMLEDILSNDTTVTLIEWASRLAAFPALYPQAYLDIRIESAETDDSERRTLTLTAHGVRYQAVIDALRDDPLHSR